MKHVTTLGLTLLLLSGAPFLTSTAAEVDYSECAEFFNNDAPTEGNAKGYRNKRSGPFVPRRLRLIPFDLQDDGSVKLHAGATLSTQEHPNGAISKQTIVHQSSPLQDLEKLASDKFSGETRRVESVIERNTQGHITKIIENRGLVTQEEQDREIARMAEWSRYDLPFAYVETQTSFTVTKGQCVPLESREIVVRERNGKKVQSHIVAFDTRLCRRINEFLYKRPGVLEFFSSDTGEAMIDLFEEEAQALLFPDNKDREFLSDGEINEIANEHLSQYHGRRSLRMQVLTGYLVQTQFGQRVRMESMGAHPMLSAMMIRSNCYYQRVGPFVNSSDFWD